MQAYFESVPHDASCAYCMGSRPVTPLPEPLAAIYCISLQEQPHRMRQATAEFHRIGLCRHVTFYRPVREDYAERAIWESHRALARHALANGRHCALMLEDDIDFRQRWSVLAPRIERAIKRLPADWYGLYLGHVPLQAYFVRPNIMRVRSAGAHAYIAGPRLLAWLEDTDPFSTDVPTWSLIGHTIDGALANLPGMYALFPMAVLQRFLGDYRVNTRINPASGRRGWRDIDRWRYYFIFRGALAMQALAVVLSPFHYLTLEGYRQRDVAKAQELTHLIRSSGLFDDHYYFRCRPDVARYAINPLRHYLRHGAAEGAWPNPLFDPLYYAAQNPDLDREHALVHFIQFGAALGRKPHPLFDTAFYVSRYGDKIPSGINPLAHFLNAGSAGTFDPHPLFDSAWYLLQNPKVRERGENPLVHYLTEGWRQGAKPHPRFDGDLYLQKNPDVKAAGVNPLDHFARHGQEEGRPQPVPSAP
jgi:GR25 family glycosyltransferase involved in LPS biosynthesis